MKQFPRAEQSSSLRIMGLIYNKVTPQQEQCRMSCFIVSTLFGVVLVVVVDDDDDDVDVVVHLTGWR